MANRDPKFKWFRTYADIVDNAKMRLLAFEDRWHFVALCALKCDGMLEDDDDPLIHRKIALKLGVQLRELDEIKRRLMEVALIDEHYRPVKWEMRQHRTPNLPDGESLEGYRGYIYFIADEALEAVKIGYSKNPWARVKDLQTGRPAKLSVVATVRTTEVSEVTLHDIFSDERQAGEWFYVSTRIQGVISEIKAKKILDVDSVARYVANYVATTKETETDTETDKISPNGECSSGDEHPTCDEVMGLWNDSLAPQLGKPRIRKLDGARRATCKARCAEFTLDEWRETIVNIRGSPFLRGDSGWNGFAFDWWIKKANFTKILEGNYND